MRVDVPALGTFHRMAREGAGLAAGRLTHMTGVSTVVEVTKLNFVRGKQLRQDLADGTDRVGIRVSLSGGIEGHSLVVFDRESALSVVDTIVAESDSDEFDEMNRSAAAELGQVMNSGFVDGWADVLETVIDIAPPVFLEGSTADPFFEDIPKGPADEEFVLAFESNLEAVDTEIAFDHYLFPDRDSMADLLDRIRVSDGIEFDKLEGLDRMAEQGAEEIATAATRLTGIETTVEIRRLTFVSLETIPQQVPNERLVGVAFEFEGTPSGYLLFLFSEDSAREIIEAMLPTPVGEEPFDEMGESAITELGNIMASSFLDGWANVLDTTIDHSIPEFVHDLGPAAVDPAVTRLGEHQDYAFVFDTAVVADGQEFDARIYAITDERDLERALNALDVDRIDETPTTAEFGELEGT